MFWVNRVIPLSLLLFVVVIPVRLIVRLHIHLLLFVKIGVASGVRVVGICQILWIVIGIIWLGVNVWHRQWEPILSKEIVDIVD